ncbi:paralemmin-1 isoform X1 [Ornithorhynchus anatinus]|uniref:Paralemmin-1 n=2 Tax=Ornithorhynchus anatinus TaxID=9258 RepID=A0A6I8N5F0_ORNAN|nr:paralemmin-1 isoform X1 [Ornithorhynchus anatinus]
MVSGERIPEATMQQERLQAIAEKRKRQTEIENKRRQLEDDRRQLQHLKSKALRERWLLEGAPSSASQEDEAMKKQMQEDEQKTKLLEDTILRLEKELDVLENGDSATSTQDSLAEVVATVTVREEVKEEKVVNVQKTPVGTPKEKKVTNSPMKVVDGSSLMKAAMYSVEITVEKDKITGETKVLSSTTLLPKDLSLQGVKVYEDEMKVVHAVRTEDGAVENGIQLLSSSEVDELIHKADEMTQSEASEQEPPGRGPGQSATPRKEIVGVRAQPGENPAVTGVVAAAGGEGVAEPSQEQPVTMIFMGYQNVEDEDETKKVLGLQDTIKAELVMIGDPPAVAKPETPPPNGRAAESPTPAPAEEAQAAAQPAEPAGAEQDLDMKKQRCKCCTVM